MSVLLESHQSLRYYRFPGLSAFPELRHGVFTRQGGVSQGPFTALNVSFSVGDLPEAVRENRRRLAEALGLATLASARQVHGTEAVFLAQEVPPRHGPERAEADILITRQPGVGLLIKQADCQAVFLYDPHQRVVANVHCGWRGQVQEILLRAVRVLEETFHCQPAHLFAAIGPGLGPCCAQFVNYQREFPQEMWGYQVRPGFFDLWRLSRDQLLAAGLKASHIECAELCTRCRPQDFFSYRRDRRTGRQGAVIALAE